MTNENADVRMTNAYVKCWRKWLTYRNESDICGMTNAFAKC